MPEITCPILSLRRQCPECGRVAHLPRHSPQCPVPCSWMTLCETAGVSSTESHLREMNFILEVGTQLKSCEKTPINLKAHFCVRN